MDWKSAKTDTDGKVLIPANWLYLYYYEALNILFRMENAMRVFVYVVLKNKFKDKWTDTTIQMADGEQSSIAAAAAKRLAQAQGFGYLGYEITSPLMYLNSGELTQIICAESYWNLFKPYFRGKKEIIKNKLDEIGTVRNALAHFRPLKYDDIELLKQNVKHAFVGIEQCLTEMIQTYRVVPTNTEDRWYKSLMTLGSDHCGIRLLQNTAEKWIRAQLTYDLAVLKDFGPSNYRMFQVTNLISPAVIGTFPELARHCTFMIESFPYPPVTRDNTPRFAKELSLVFSKSALVENYAVVTEQIQNLFAKVETETELIQKDNLARGALVTAGRITCAFNDPTGPGGTGWWSVNFNDVTCGFDEHSPPEYWAELNLYTDDFIATSSKYPWMPSAISAEEVPF